MTHRPQSPEEIVRTLIDNEFVQQVAKYVHASEAETARLRKENSTFREKFSMFESLPGAPKVPETSDMIPQAFEKPDSRQDVRQTPLQPLRAWGQPPTASGFLPGEVANQRQMSNGSGGPDIILCEELSRPASAQAWASNPGDLEPKEDLEPTDDQSVMPEDLEVLPDDLRDKDSEDGDGPKPTQLAGSRNTRKAGRSLGMVKKSRRSQVAPVIAREHHYSAVHIVNHVYFQKAITCFILVNSLVVGIQINHDAVSDDESQFFNIFEYITVFVFTSELILTTLALERLGMLRKPFEHRADWEWYAFDILLVTFSWIDIILTFSIGDKGDATGTLGPVKKFMKTLRMARIMRILRVVKFLHDLHMMISLVVGSIAHSFWLFVLLIGNLYIMAVVLTDGATQWRKPLTGERPLDDEEYEAIDVAYGTITRSMYTLFKSMTGGVDWGEPADLSATLGWTYFSVYVIYTFFSVFSVLNIVNGIFVDAAIQKSSNDRYVRLRQNEEAKERYAEGLADQLERFDMDHSGFITKDEWQTALMDPHVLRHMEALEVVVREAQDLFGMLDVNDDGMVTISEFQEGMQKLKGSAMSVDLMAVAAKVNHLFAHQERDSQDMFDRLDKLEASMKTAPSNDFGSPPSGLRSAADPMVTFT